jgi:cytosine/adenosine deaminase-related metal-dependent hydrolase
MAIEVTALIRKETKVDPRKPNDKGYYASLSLLNAEGKEYGPPRFLSEFREVAVLLRREAGVTHGRLHEQLHERHASYERGEEVRICLVLENDEAIKKLGFDPKAA